MTVQTGSVSFGFEGEADRVELATFMPRFPKDIAFSRAEGRWELEIPLPHLARIEYRLRVWRHGRSHLITDPKNPAVASNPFGNNSVATGSGYRLPAFMNEEAPSGGVSEIRVASRLFSQRRSHHLYQPSGFTESTPLPLLMVHDGSDYLSHANLGLALDVMIHRGEISPLRAVLLDPRARHAEYVASPDHAAHVVKEVLPHVAKRVALTTPIGIMGASLGAVAAFHTARSFPGTFDRLFLQSGTFAETPHPELSNEMLAPIARFCDSARRNAQLHGARVYMTCGRYESLIDWNRTMATCLVDQFVDASFVESWSGHDWGAWRDHFESGLRFLFPA